MGKSRAMSLMTVVGLCLVGVSAGVVSGLNARQKAYTVQQLAAHWKAPFDLLVLPKGSHVSVGQVADPNAIDEGIGGITIAQDQKIASLAGVEVAAPLVPLGLIGMDVGINSLPLPNAPGVFRMRVTTENVGLSDSGAALTLYMENQMSMKPAWSPQVYGLVVAIDPVAEAKLVGLDKAVIQGSYFTAGVRSSLSTYSYTELPSNVTKTAPYLQNLPLLFNSESPAAGFDTVTIQRLDLPFSFAKASTYFHVPIPYTSSPVFRNLAGPVVFHASISAAQYWHVWEESQTGHGQPAKLGPFSVDLAPATGVWGFLHTGPVQYVRVASPFPSRWPIALKALPEGCAGSCTDQADYQGEPFRMSSGGNQVLIGWTPIGFYNPSKVHEARDPLTHLPLVNYRMEEGQLVLSSSGKALNPPEPVLPGESPLGLFTPAPTAITDIQDVEPILGKAPISSIRVKVQGVNVFSSGSQTKLQRVADEIHKATGLTVEIIRGASPQQVLIHPGYEKGYTKVGWIQEEWVRLGAGMEILRQTLLSQDVILVPVLFGALVFALTVGVIGVEVRRKEYATLLALGVMPQTVRRTILVEGLLYGTIVFVLALGVSTAIAGMTALGVRLAVALIAAVVMTAALVPVAWGAGRMDPLTALKEPTPTLARVLAPVSVLGLGLSLFFSSAKRHAASLLALLVPGGVFYMIFMVEGAINHTFYLTALGHYILIHVSPLMEVGAAVAVLLAILASAQIGLRNAVLRARTWAIGQAVGWPARVAVTASFVEAGVVGLLAGLIGASAAAVVGDPLFGVAFQPTIWGEAVGVILLSGLLAALPSSFVLSRQEPLSHLRGEGV